MTPGILPAYAPGEALRGRAALAAIGPMGWVADGVDGVIATPR